MHGFLKVGTRLRMTLDYTVDMHHPMCSRKRHAENRQEDWASPSTHRRVTETVLTVATAAVRSTKVACCREPAQNSRGWASVNASTPQDPLECGRWANKESPWLVKKCKQRGLLGGGHQGKLFTTEGGLRRAGRALERGVMHRNTGSHELESPWQKEGVSKSWQGSSR